MRSSSRPPAERSRSGRRTAPTGPDWRCMTPVRASPPQSESGCSRRSPVAAPPRRQEPAWASRSSEPSPTPMARPSTSRANRTAARVSPSNSKRTTRPPRVGPTPAGYSRPVALRGRRSMAGIRALVALLVAVLAASAAPAGAHDDGQAHHSLRAAVTDQNFYFVMADRFDNGTTANDQGGLPPGKHEGQSGFDPTGKGWYHGGDLQGVRDHLRYIKRLGTTAIWLTPSFKNKAVQDNNGFPSAGYHGYWITDFTQIDPHLGTNDDLKALIQDAHGLGMKVYFDIISNHTADVIRYEEGAAPVYKSKDQVPYRTATGTVFDDRDFAGGSTFPALDPAVSFPYHPFVPANEPPANV